MRELLLLFSIREEIMFLKTKWMLSLDQNSFHSMFRQETLPAPKCAQYGSIYTPLNFTFNEIEGGGGGCQNTGTLATFGQKTGIFTHFHYNLTNL